MLSGCQSVDSTSCIDLLLLSKALAADSQTCKILLSFCALMQIWICHLLVLSLSTVLNVGNWTESSCNPTETRTFCIGLSMDIWSHSKRLLLAGLVGVQRSFETWNITWLLWHLGVIDLPSWPWLSLWAVSWHLSWSSMCRGMLLTLNGRSWRLSHNWSTIHPIKSNQKRWINFDLVSSLH